MPYIVTEWLNLVLRWAHIFAAILWVGQTYFFTWLDKRLSDPEEKGALWMVHSGGFYVVGKQKAPELSRRLHWFRWEAAITWATGMLLFIVVYYMGGIMIDATVSSLTNGQAVALSMGLLAAGWIVYDLLWISPLAKSEPVAVAISFLLIVATAWGLTRVCSSRFAYLQVGAMLGTLMAANVWMRILPAQRQMIAAVRDGKDADATLAYRAKFRSKHNTFMVVPVVFIMISSHFPIATYGHQYNWAILGALTLAGWVVAKLIREH